MQRYSFDKLALRSPYKTPQPGSGQHRATTSLDHQFAGRSLTVKTGPQAAAQKVVAGFKTSDIRCVTRCDGVIKHYDRARPELRHDDGFWLRFQAVEAQVAREKMERGSANEDTCPPSGRLSSDS